MASSPAWKLRVLNLAADYKTALQEGNFSKFAEKRGHANYTEDEIKRMANEFPGIETVMEDQTRSHQGLTDDYNKVTDDLESGGADKPTAIERVKAQAEKMKAESIANIDANTKRVLALIESLPEDQQDLAADFWESLSDGFMKFWKEVLNAIERIFEAVVNWLKKVWEQVKACWETVKGIWDEIWKWLEGLKA
ncbi:hypothetical protein MAC_09791 [Metarhizium acridum CQMa 102]|uniref:Uncharacterized protein n=1 Tax=Metarhizium acridum (strain CQMa 102) TaxID=655827 RepID=E9EIU3_METAQ|nr:uncharacterized protein MAC_09791 [Metarhizium acridum CQMa 102]EFY84165.1 hypothetical protein MAC_09791 [Metarhizium acridum CQMa 102]